MVVTSRGRESGLGEAVSECPSVAAKAVPMTYTRVTVGIPVLSEVPAAQPSHHL